MKWPNLEADVMLIRRNGKMLVKIKSDGSMEFGPDYQPDEAATAFWDAVQRQERLRSQEDTDD